jgi:hypothetical protein
MAHARTSGSGIIAALCWSWAPVSMSVLTVVFPSTTVLKLLLNSTKCCSQIGCQQFEVITIELCNDAENANAPFLKRLVEPS